MSESLSYNVVQKVAEKFNPLRRLHESQYSTSANCCKGHDRYI